MTNLFVIQRERDRESKILWGGSNGQSQFELRLAQEHFPRQLKKIIEDGKN